MSRRSTPQITGSSKISFVVGNDMLGTVVQLLQDHRVHGLTITPESVGVSTSSDLVAHVLKNKKVRPPSRAATTRLGKIILEHMSKHEGPPLSSRHIGLFIETQGFNKDSASPCLSDLLKEGMVERTEIEPRRYVYTLAKT